MISLSVAIGVSSFVQRTHCKVRSDSMARSHHSDDADEPPQEHHADHSNGDRLNPAMDLLEMGAEKFPRFRQNQIEEEAARQRQRYEHHQRHLIESSRNRNERAYRRNQPSRDHGDWTVTLEPARRAPHLLRLQPQPDAVATDESLESLPRN